MLNYLLEVTLCWATLYAVYVLILSRETFFRYNRGYLLGSLMLGLLLPFVAEWLQTLRQAPVPLPEVLVPIAVDISAVSEQYLPVTTVVDRFSVLDALTFTYWTGVVLATLRFVYGLAEIARTYRRGKKQRLGAFELVTLPSGAAPFSFFNRIFWPVSETLDSTQGRSIIAHELVHVRQWHTLDVLFTELLAVLFWWNPLIYGFRRALRTVHEYLADAGATAAASRRSYGRLLITRARHRLTGRLSHHFAQTQLKKRITMLTKKPSPRSRYGRYLAALPVVLLFSGIFMYKDGLAQLEQVAMKDLLPLPTVVSNDWRLQFDTALASLFEKYINELHGHPSTSKIGAQIESLVAGTIESHPERVDYVLDRLWYNFDHYQLSLTAHAKPDGTIGIGGIIPATSSIETPQVRPIMQLRYTEAPRLRSCADIEGSEANECTHRKVFAHINTTLQRPAIPAGVAVDPTVRVRIVIDQNGSVIGFSPVNNPGYGMSRAAVDALQGLGDWEPARLNGEPVEATYTAVIKFDIPELDSENSNPFRSALTRFFQPLLSSDASPPVAGEAYAQLTNVLDQERMTPGHSELKLFKQLAFYENHLQQLDRLFFKVDYSNDRIILSPLGEHIQPKDQQAQDVQPVVPDTLPVPQEDSTTEFPTTQDKTKDPLIVVDGEIYEAAMEDIDPETIQAIDVLKGTSAVAKYGAAGRAGVIEVTTKQAATNEAAAPGDFPILVVVDGDVLGTVDGADPRSFSRNIPPGHVDKVELYGGKRAVKRYGGMAGVGVLEITTEPNRSPNKAVKVEARGGFAVRGATEVCGDERQYAKVIFLNESDRAERELDGGFTLQFVARPSGICIPIDLHVLGTP